MTTYDGIFIQNYDPSIDITQSLLWQYQQSPSLLSLVNQKETWYYFYQEQFWNYWIHDVFTLSTATDFGLAVWSIILGLPLTYGMPPDPDDKFTFGFGPLVDIQHENFGNSNGAYPIWHGGNFSGGGVVGLTTDEKRLLLWLRYFYLTTRGDVTDINRFFQFLFEDTFNYGPAYMLDNLNMTVTFVFVGFTLSPIVQLFLDNFNILPIPAGVGYNIEYIDELFLTLAGGPLGLLEGGYLELLSTETFSGDNINLLDNTPLLLLNGGNLLELTTEYVNLLDNTPFLLLNGQFMTQLL